MKEAHVFATIIVNLHLAISYYYKEIPSKKIILLT